MSNNDGRIALRKAYDGLRAVDESLDNVHESISRVRAAHALYFPDISHQSNREWEQPFEGGEAKEWLDRARRSGLLESATNLDREEAVLQASEDRLNDIQDSLRYCANLLSRPFLRRLGILDMPDEILVMIFEILDWNQKDIKNCRLTCRRVCNASSHLLVRNITVYCQKASVTRLEQISRHPLFSKGVDLVRVRLDAYDPTLSADVDEFVEFYAENLERRLEHCEPVPVSRFSIAKIDTARNILASWRHFRSEHLGGDNNQDEESTNSHRALVYRAHAEYRRLYEEQGSQRVEFAQAVGSAMARMPLARNLEVVDLDTDFYDHFEYDLGSEDWYKACELFRSDADDVYAIYQDMQKPISGFHASRAGRRTPPLHNVISELPGAIRDSGAWLQAFSVKLYYLGDTRQLVSAGRTRKTCASATAMQQLKEFTFLCFHCHDRDEDMANLNDVLAAFLDAPRLEKLTLEDPEDPEDSEYLGGLGKALTSRSLGHLTKISLQKVAMGLSDLVLFLRNVPPSLSSISLNRFCLLSGTWAEALEVLREKQCAHWHFRSLVGAEASALIEEGDSSTYFKIFDISGCVDSVNSTNSAELYVSRRIDVNPLKALYTKSDKSESEMDSDW